MNNVNEINMATRMYDHFTIKEVLRNCCADERLECIEKGYIDYLLLLLQILDNFRDYLQHPIRIQSSYRDLEHNKNVGGSSTSQHLIGQAIDFTSSDFLSDFQTFADIFKEYLQTSPMACFLGQVIIYYNKKIIHISLTSSKHKKLTIYEQGKN